MSETQARAFRWAIVGNSGVARQVAYGISDTHGAGEVASLIARDPTRTKAAAGAVGAAHWSTEFSDALADGIDGVYLAVPLGLHEELAIAALQAGKAVLVEKPLALTAEAAQRIADASERTGAFCMEAMWPRFLPLYRQVKSKIEAGDLGQMRQFVAAFSGATEMDPGFGVFDGAQRGGALMHRACYGVSMARYLLGPITGVKAFGRLTETGVDAHVALLLSHAGGATSSITASYETTAQDQVLLAGTGGTISLAPSLYRPTQGRMTQTRAKRLGHGIPSGEARKSSVGWNKLRDRAAPLQALRRRVKVLRAELNGFGYGYQAAEVVRAVQNGETGSPLMPLSESIEIAGVLDAAYAQLQGAEG